MIAIWRSGVWLLVVGAGLGVGLGFLGPLRDEFDILSHFRPHFGLLALLGSVLAFWVPSRRLKYISLAVAVLAFAMLGPAWRSVEAPPKAGVETRDVTVMTANLLGKNPTLDLSLGALLAVDADVLVTVETPRAVAKRPSVVSAHYPYSTVTKGTRNGVIVWSKFPLERIDLGKKNGTAPAFAKARVDLGGGTGFGVTGVHLSWPLIANGVQSKQIASIGSLLPAKAGPQVLVGDFNAAPWSDAMRRVEANTGLRLIGGLRLTWRGVYPNPLHYLMTGDLSGNGLPAPIGHHIDHVLLGGGIGVDAAQVRSLPGSDHRAVWVSLQVPVVKSQ